MKRIFILSLIAVAFSLSTFGQNPKPVASQTTGKHNGHDWVDLGLPSGLKWATCNVGASSPSDYGDYFAWGETYTKSSYTNGNSTTYSKEIGDIAGNPTYDLARAKWCGSWRLPTEKEFQELIDNCTWEWTTQDGHKGYKVTSKKNGNSIFLPAAGWRYGSSSSSQGSYGGYWSATPYESNTYYAYGLGFYEGYHCTRWRNRYDGLSVRPVIAVALSLSTFGENPKPVVQDNSFKTREFSVNGVSFKMVAVEGGTFQMGAQYKDSEKDNYDQYAQVNEQPVHSVTLSNYYIGETEVTQALWEAVMGSNPSYFKGSDKPVECVSYEDCVTFVNKLNSLLSAQLPGGRKFRLPTEAEWEFAARGGNRSQGYRYSGSNTLSSVAWYGEFRDIGSTHPVKQKQANELGLYDMSGNVWEWCYDWYGDYSSSSQTNPKGPSTGSNRVLRGGGWCNYELYFRVADRDNVSPGRRFSNSGLRLAL